MYDPLKWAIGILAFCCIIMTVIAMISKTKPQDREEGEKYPFDERDIYQDRKNGQDKHKKSA